MLITFVSFVSLYNINTPKLGKFKTKCCFCTKNSKTDNKSWKYFKIVNDILT